MSTHWPRRRMHHVFAPDGRAVIAAMDAGITKGVALRPRTGPRGGPADRRRRCRRDPGHHRPGPRRLADELGGTGLILALDSEIPSAQYGVEQAVRWGADALELKVFPGNPGVTKMGELRELCAEADRWGMPVMAEPIPIGFKALEAHTLANIAHGARVSAEAGADFVKAQYTGTPEDYREVVEGAWSRCSRSAAR